MADEKVSDGSQKSINMAAKKDSKNLAEKGWDTSRFGDKLYFGKILVPGPLANSNNNALHNHNTQEEDYEEPSSLFLCVIFPFGRSYVLHTTVRNRKVERSSHSQIAKK